MGNLEEVGTGDASGDLSSALFSEQMADLVEELVDGAVDVEGGSQSGNVLSLNHHLSPDGRNVEFLDQVRGGVQCDNKIL